MTNKQNPAQSPIVCRRYPPQVVVLVVNGAALATQQNPTGMAQVPQGIPPAVSGDWSCGEFAPQLSRVVQ